MSRAFSPLRRVGLPIPLYRRMLFDNCRDVGHVRQAVAKHPMIGRGSNHVVADAAGDVVGYALSESQDGICVMTVARVNLTGSTFGEQAAKRRQAETSRRELFVKLCKEARHSSDLVSEMKRILACHDDGLHPHSSPCRHNGRATAHNTHS